MEWYIVLSLVVAGLLLLVVEIVLIPGTTVAGFIGFGMLLVGIALSFKYFDNSTAWIIVGSTGVISGFIFYWTFSSNPWKRFALKSTIDSKVNEGDLDGLKVGDAGVSISALRPMGKADFGGRLIEVTSLGSYVESGTQIKIIRISLNQITIEPLN